MWVEMLWIPAFARMTEEIDMLDNQAPISVIPRKIGIRSIPFIFYI
ncbi:hypothetical protein ES705_40642 [subsurface metagenome]